MSPKSEVVLSVSSGEVHQIGLKNLAGVCSPQAVFCPCRSRSIRNFYGELTESVFYRVLYFCHGQLVQF